MNLKQRQAAMSYANATYQTDTVAADVSAENPTDFDEVSNGVWVRAWVFVPAKDIPGYSMEPAAPPAVVETVRTPPITD